jgi:multidrug resistance efflux pump
MSRTSQQNESKCKRSAQPEQEHYVAFETVDPGKSFIERWALMIFLFFLMVLVAGAAFIKYPELIHSEGNLSAANSPKEIAPIIEGRLINFFHKNSSSVKRNDLIGIIDGTADAQSVSHLHSDIDTAIQRLQLGNLQMISKSFINQYEKLGELQKEYQSFSFELQKFDDFLVNGFYSQKRQSLQEDMKGLYNSKEQLIRQKELSVQDLKLAEESYKMNSRLYEEKVISSEELRIEKSKLIAKQKSIPEYESLIMQNEQQARQILKQIEEQDHESRKQTMNLSQSLLALKSSIEEWNRKHSLVAPIDGKLIITTFVQENQVVKANLPIGYIQPDNSQYFIQTYLPHSNLGKVDTGMIAQIRFEAYPFQEYGEVKGILSSLSDIGTDKGFAAKINIPGNLLTSSGFQIPYKDGLKAQVSVVTSNKSLLQRFWYSLKKSTSGFSR